MKLDNKKKVIKLKVADSFSINYLPGRTVRADIRLNILKIMEVLVELSVQTRMSGSKPRSFIRSTNIRTDICLDIGVTNIRARSLLLDVRVVRITRHGASVILRISTRYTSGYPSGYPHGQFSQG